LDYGAETVTITFGPDSRDLTKVAADLAVNRDSRALSLLASPRQGGSRPAPQHQLPTLVPLRNAGLR
jgi:hypothetical protein